MFSGFQHAIAGGQGNLIVTALQSPNFRHLVQGWQIARDGSAEFNDLTIRGTFLGNDYEINQDGIFFYSPVPGPGNLVLSISQNNGTDRYGNGYVAGISVTGQGGTAVLNVTSSQPELMMRPSGAATLLDAPVAWAGTNATGTGAEQAAINLYSGTEIGNPGQPAYIIARSGSQDTTASPQFIVQLGSTGVFTVFNTAAELTVPLFAIGSLGTGPQLISTFLNGWNPVSTAAWPYFELEPDGTVFISGQITRTTALSGTTTLFQLPPGYYNTTTASFGLCGVMNPSSPYTTTGITIYVDTSGLIHLYGSYTANYYLNLNFRFNIHT